MTLRFMAEVALGREMDDDEFLKAAIKAKNKQARIYAREGRAEVKRLEYLAQLVKEAVVEAEFSKLTMRVCEVVNG